METAVSIHIHDLQQLSMEQLRQCYRALFEEDHPTKHRDVLVRRIAWRLHWSATTPKQQAFPCNRFTIDRWHVPRSRW